MKRLILLAFTLCTVLSTSAQSPFQAMETRVKLAQEFLKQNGFAGWLLYDFRGSNPIARELVKPAGIVTRRWFYFIPASGKPIALVHKIEISNLGHIPGAVETYSSRESLVGKLGQILPTGKKVLMEYSPQGNNAYVSYVDAGTFELIKSLGIKVESSQDLVEHLLARWSPDQYRSHKEAAAALLKIKDLAFAHVAEKIRKGASLTEYDLQQYIVAQYRKNDLIADDDPICAVNANAGNPHYAPTKEVNKPIKKGDLLLIDIWAKKNAPESVYADITWTAYVGDKVPEKFSLIFRIVAQARDAAIAYLKKYYPARDIRGYQIDQAAREVVRKAGYADFFTHRTGHSIGKDVHSWGVNIDGYESKDERKVIPQVAFSIEPGIYLKDFGIRSENDVYVGEKSIEVTTLPLQTGIIPLLKAK